MILPTVHRNGTSKAELLDQLCNAGAAVRAALEAMARATPNGRDYYHQVGALNVALLAHSKRMDLLRTLADELEAEAIALDTAFPD